MKRSLILLAGLVFASGAFAAQSTHHHHHAKHKTSEATEATNSISNIYVGGALGMTDTHYDPIDSTGFGFNLLAGYRFNDLWSVEGSFTHFADATSTATTIHTNSVAGLAKISLPIGETKFKFISKMGLGYTMASGAVSNSHFGPVFGVGAALPLNEQMNIEASYTHFAGSTGTNSVPNADFYGATFTYLLPGSLFS